MQQEKVRTINTLQKDFFTKTKEDSFFWQKIEKLPKWVLVVIFAASLVAMILGFVLLHLGKFSVGGLLELLAIMLLFVFVMFLEKNEAIKKYWNLQETSLRMHCLNALEDAGISTREQLESLILYATQLKGDRLTGRVHHLHTKDILGLESTLGGVIIATITSSMMAPGKNQIRIHIEGKASHAGVDPDSGINAICAAGMLIADAPQGRIDEETTCNLGKIVGGSATNVVAESCDVFYESRSRDKAKLDKITKDICDHFVNGAAKTRCKITAEVSPDYGPYCHEKDSPAIKTAVKAAEKLGLPVKLEESGGGSDANHFNTYGVPTVVLSVGMEKAHTKDEYIEIKDLYDSARWTLEIVKTVAENK